MMTDNTPINPWCELNAAGAKKCADEAQKLAKTAMIIAEVCEKDEKEASGAKMSDGWVKHARRFAEETERWAEKAKASSIFATLNEHCKLPNEAELRAIDAYAAYLMTEKLLEMTTAAHDQIIFKRNL